MDKLNAIFKVNAIFKEFDRIYGEYEEFVKHEEWGNANDARSYMMGMAQCMQILWTKEMGEATFQEVERRCGLATGSIPVNQPLAQEVTETVCDDLCKYRDTADEDLICNYMREHDGECPLDRLQ